MMKKLMILLFAVALFPFNFSSCIDEGAEVLPEATMEGKNTFGCLVNGEVWLPKGYNGTPNLNLSYDPGYDNGTVDLRSYRIYSSESGDSEYVILYINNISDVGTFHFSDTAHTEVVFYGRKNSCEYRSRSSTTFNTGNITITRFDLKNQIISGTFEFSLAKPGCDTIKVTQGRFDMKI